MRKNGSSARRQPFRDLCGKTLSTSARLLAVRGTSLTSWPDGPLVIRNPATAGTASRSHRRAHDASLTQVSDKRHVSQCPIWASLTKRSPRGFQPLRRTMLVVTAVSSINTRRAGSGKPCSRIQRRRARATSVRLRSTARKLFFDGDAMASEEAGQRTAAPWDTPPMKRRDNLIQTEVRLRTDDCEDLPRMLLQCEVPPRLQDCTTRKCRMMRAG